MKFWNNPDYPSFWSRLVSTINQYNLLYNTVADMQFSRDAESKRWLENCDPSINYSQNVAASEYITLQRNTASVG